MFVELSACSSVSLISRPLPWPACLPALPISHPSATAAGQAGVPSRRLDRDMSSTLRTEMSGIGPSLTWRCARSTAGALPLASVMSSTCTRAGTIFAPLCCALPSIEWAPQWQQLSAISMKDMQIRIFAPCNEFTWISSMCAVPALGIHGLLTGCAGIIQHVAALLMAALVLGETLFYVGLQLTFPSYQ